MASKLLLVAALASSLGPPHTFEAYGRVKPNLVIGKIPRARVHSGFRDQERGERDKAYEIWTGFHPLVGAPEWLKLHRSVCIRNVKENTCSIHDFLPENTRPDTMLAMLTAQAVPGRIREISSEKVKNFLGTSSPSYTCPPSQGRLHCRISGKQLGNAIIDRVRKLNRMWDSNIALLRNDCGTYASALVADLCSTHYQRSTMITT
ncbi:hypothetical protein AAMO2058_000545400 [Amorphochlora amoebiformis]